jgi:hypothetical protein
MAVYQTCGTGWFEDSANPHARFISLSRLRGTWRYPAGFFRTYYSVSIQVRSFSDCTVEPLLGRIASAHQAAGWRAGLYRTDLSGDERGRRGIVLSHRGLFRHGAGRWGRRLPDDVATPRRHSLAGRLPDDGTSRSRRNLRVNCHWRQENCACQEQGLSHKF